MNKKLGINTPKDGEVQKVYIRPSWVKNVEEELCPDCFKVVGDKNRYTVYRLNRDAHCFEECKIPY